MCICVSLFIYICTYADTLLTSFTVTDQLNRLTVITKTTKYKYIYIYRERLGDVIAKLCMMCLWFHLPYNSKTHKLSDCIYVYIYIYTLIYIYIYMCCWLCLFALCCYYCELLLWLVLVLVLSCRFVLVLMLCWLVVLLTLILCLYYYYYYYHHHCYCYVIAAVWRLGLVHALLHALLQGPVVQGDLKASKNKDEEITRLARVGWLKLPLFTGK